MAEVKTKRLQVAGSLSGSTNGLPIPETAAVGQYIMVSAVDENGKVTATEAVTVVDASETLFYLDGNEVAY